MNSLIKTNFVKLNISISKIGIFTEKESDELQKQIFEFFKKKELNISGSIKCINIDNFEFEKNHTPLDTSSK